MSVNTQRPPRPAVELNTALKRSQGEIEKYGAAGDDRKVTMLNEQLGLVEGIMTANNRAIEAVKSGDVTGAGKAIKVM